MGTHTRGGLNYSEALKFADTWFSRFIRMRDILIRGTCITCDKPIEFETCDAGHWIDRGRMSTRFHPLNVNAQCRYCNRACDGLEKRHGNRIKLLYGKKAYDDLKALRNSVALYKSKDLERIGVEFKSRYLAMKK